MKVVRRSDSSRPTASERSTNPSYIDWKRMKNSEMSAEELGAEDPVGDLVEGLGGHVHEPRPVGDDQPPQEAGREEVGHALGGVEEVEGVAGRRGVHHDEVVVALRVDLVEALHGDVVVALDEPARDVLVQRVGQDLVPGLLVGGMAADQGVPRLLGVEHGRPQLTPGLEAGGPEGLVGHPVLGVADPVQAEGVGQPLGRVDGEDEHLAAVADARPSPPRPPPWWSCPPRPARRRRRSPWWPAGRRSMPPAVRRPRSRPRPLGRRSPSAVLVPPSGHQ